MSLQELEELFYLEKSKKKEDNGMNKLVIFIVVFIIVIILIYVIFHFVNENKNNRQKPARVMPNPIINCVLNSDCNRNVNHKKCINNVCKNENIINNNKHMKNEQFIGRFLIDVNDVKKGNRKYNENDLKIIEEYNKYVLNN